MSQSDKWLLICGRERQSSGFLKNSTSGVLQQCQNKVFQRKDFCYIFERLNSVFYDARAISLQDYFILTLLENNRSAVFEATSNFAFSLP